jgi:alpha-tubulin suppressor-like RCC1 family protein
VRHPRTRQSRHWRAGIIVLASLAALSLPIAFANSAAALAAVGRLGSFGANSYGELGNNSTVDSSTPVNIANVPLGAAFFAAGTRHNLAILPNSNVVAWGRNASGELGLGEKTGPTTCPTVPATPCAKTPIAVKNSSGTGTLTGAAAVDGSAPACTTSCTSHAGHSMALLTNGIVLGWGHGNSGQVGDGVALPIPAGTDHDVLLPHQVVGLGAGSGVGAIAAGASHSLALKTNGAVLAWGNDQSGQLGTGGALPGTDKSTPQSVSGLGASTTDPVVAIGAGDSFSVALKKDGSVWTWGNNASGELGNGTLGTDSSLPHQVNTLGPSTTNPVTAISAGSAFVVALKKNGAVVAWGKNASGELGNNSTTDSLNPVSVSGLGAGSGVSSLATGSAHVLALRSNGTLLAWGHNASGQLGDGTTTDRHVPKALSLTRVTRVAAGGAHTIIARAPVITLNPNSGVAGTHIAVAGSGFGNSEQVKVFYQTNIPSPTQVQICAVTASSTGTFSCSSSTTVIPTTDTGSAGAHALVAVGTASGLRATKNFVLRPTVGVSPSSGPPGTMVTVTGSRFKPSETVTVLYLTELVSPATQTLCTTTATSTGTISCAATIPTTNAGPTGAHSITATGSATKTAGTASYTLT